MCVRVKIISEVASTLSRVRLKIFYNVKFDRHELQYHLRTSFVVITTGNNVMRRRTFVGRTAAPKTPSELLFPVEHRFRFDVKRFRFLQQFHGTLSFRWNNHLNILETTIESHKCINNINQIPHRIFITP